MIDLTWPTEATDDLRGAVRRVLHDVVTDGGAVGYLAPPSRHETDTWLTDTLAADGALVVAAVDGVVQAMGTWRRESAAVLAHSAEVTKVMAHPAARGLGLGRRVVAALVEHARAAAVEILTLSVRGNNHGSIQLYEELGFRVSGLLPNRVADGDDRFDDVHMMLSLGHPPGARLYGSAAGGPGSTPKRVSAGPARS